MQIDPEQLNELIRHRRSTFPKQYAAGEKVDEHIIRQMLENANWAPSHKLTEPWRFTVFSGEGLKTFAQFQAQVYKKTAAPFRKDKYEKLLTNPLHCSHIIALGMKRHAEKNIPEVEEIASVACAVQNMYLTAAAYGIGCYWTTGGVTYIDGAKAFFGLEKEDRLLGFMYAGVIAVPSAPGKREPISEKTNWVTK